MPASLDLIERVLDPDSFSRWDSPPVQPTGDDDYDDSLSRARSRSGLDESVVTGAGTIDGHAVAVIVGEFDFMGGSVGTAAARRVIAAVRRATREGLTLVSAPVSGGTRMQEGTRAFVSMAGISGAIAQHRDAGLLYLVYLRHPTTGGTLASWGSLGHLTAAEPGALIGFLGPRVYESLTGRAFPPDVQRAEALYEHGLVDAVVDPRRLRELAATALAILAPNTPVTIKDAPLRTATHIDDWDCVRATRAPQRPGLRALLHSGADASLDLHGLGRGVAAEPLTIALARIRGRRAMLVGYDRTDQRHGRLIGPATLRSAQRAIRVAEELRLPVITVVDTPGAELSPAAEHGGIAAEIAATMTTLLRARVPVVSVLLGEGAGGAALALLPADRVIAADHAWLAPLPPEGASAIVTRTIDHADDMARQQRIGAASLRIDGIVDALVPDTGDDFVALLADAIAVNLDLAHATFSRDGIATRGARFEGRIDERGRRSDRTAAPAR